MSDESLMAVYQDLGHALAKASAQDDIGIAYEDLRNAIHLIREAVLNEISWGTRRLP